MGKLEKLMAQIEEQLEEATNEAIRLEKNGVKASAARLRKNLQQIKIFAQNGRKLAMEVKNDIGSGKKKTSKKKRSRI